MKDQFRPDCLLVIDMQEGFDSAKDPRTIKNCQQLIRQAIEDEIQIVLMEYENNGYILTQLTDLIKVYPKVTFLSKDEDDGGKIFDQCVSNKKWSFKNIQVCGVNIDACVKDTVRTLVYKHYNVQVVQKACNATRQKRNASFDDVSHLFYMYPKHEPNF